MSRAISILIAIFGMLWPTWSKCDPILDAYGSGTPVGSYGLSTVVGAGHGNSPFYVPVQSDWAGEAFRGYVYPPTAPNLAWSHYDGAFYDEDTIRIYRTWIVAGEDLQIPISVTGDDGYAIYLDGALVASMAGIGPPPTGFIMSLTAGVPRLIEAAVYNGPGPTHLTMVRQDSGTRFEDTPGVQINAEGTFVPEPGGLAIWTCIGLLALVLRRRYGR